MPSIIPWPARIAATAAAVALTSVAALPSASADPLADNQGKPGPRPAPRHW